MLRSSVKIEINSYDLNLITTKDKKTFINTFELYINYFNMLNLETG